MAVGLVVEIIVAGLLAVTTVYCVILDRRLHALRSGQDGLRDLISALDAATEKAQLSIRHLKALGDEAGGSLSGNVAQARALADELSVMIEAGDRIANRLEGAVDENKTADAGRPSKPSFGKARGTASMTERPHATDQQDEDDGEIALPSLRGVK